LLLREPFGQNKMLSSKRPRKDWKLKKKNTFLGGSDKPFKTQKFTNKIT